MLKKIPYSLWVLKHSFFGIENDLWSDGCLPSFLSISCPRLNFAHTSDILIFSSLDPKPCLAMPCRNGGSCIDHITTPCLAGVPCASHGYTCTCPFDYQGTNCERKDYILVKVVLRWKQLMFYISLLCDRSL